MREETHINTAMCNTESQVKLHSSGAHLGDDLAGWVGGGLKREGTVYTYS